VDTDSPSIAFFGLTTHLRKDQQKLCLKKLVSLTFLNMVQGNLKIVWLKIVLLCLYFCKEGEVHSNDRNISLNIFQNSIA